MKIGDRALVKGLNNLFIKNILINFFSEKTSFTEVEITLSETNFNEKYVILPPIVGIANTDKQITYSGVYSAKFCQKQQNLPLIILGRIRLLDFFVPKGIYDPEIILEEKLFQGELELIIPNLEKLLLNFYGINKNRKINLKTNEIYIEEKITIK